ncbi:MAG: hypothetical protein IPO88_04760 [Nannocystis sp.]|uniref:hypothetical protein n=1 Tax=Nannocystis sp. TaxID=1962667 RepID=UPI002424E6A8|nr:hypothetical protein [Nannocystis sp.]MBK9752813.1 hypothetical protein [Nannocystis sp.]
MTRRRAILAAILTCPVGQACSPLVFELASHDGTTQGPGETTGEPTSTTGHGETTHEPPSGPGGPDSDGFDCHNGGRDPGETDVDCGGPCPPCKPGSKCETPKDCELGVCIAGVCDPQQQQCHDIKECPPAGPCEVQNCLPSGVCESTPRSDGEPCDDGDPCTQKDECQSGKCVPFAMVDCSDLNGPCRAGLCNPVTGHCAVEWTSEGQPCEDGDKCTFDELCSGGECLAPQPKPPALFTDFSLAGGWIAEPPWQIGPAVASKCAIPKADDPGQDHSPSADNHLAGTAIGDCLPTDFFPEACLESPSVDVADYPGELWLDFWDILSTGMTMESRIDVFDGQKQDWVTLIMIPKGFISPEWMHHSEPLDAFKGPDLRVRFCQRSDGKNPPLGGWSIDDLSIGPALCPP